MKERGESVSIVIPPSPFLADERVFPFLGALKVASALEEKEVDVDVLDLSGISNYEEVMKDYLESEGRGIRNIGITATTPQFPHAVRLSEIIKEEAPEAKVIFGGAHATMVGSAKRADQHVKIERRGSRAYEQMVDTFDVIVIGDGEEAIFEAIKPDSPKVINAGERDSKFFLQRGTLESYPLPARELIDMDSYHYQIDGKDAQSMIAQLGCPFECGFCGGRNTTSFRMARTRTPDSILQEVDVLVKRYNKQGIMFYDDELNINNDSLMSLMENLIKYQERNKIDLSLRGFVKAELFTLEQAKMMYRAGFRVMLSGVESGDDGILLTMKKHTTRAINSAWVDNCHKAGLKAKALMSIGHPGETRQTVENSLQWVLDNRPDDVDWTIITQYPGSPYFDYSVPHSKENGVWVYTQPKTGAVLYSKETDFGKESSYYKGVPGDYTSYVWTDELTPQDLVILRDKVELASRTALGLTQIHSVAALQYEHSMGQGLPSSILRTNKTKV